MSKFPWQALNAIVILERVANENVTESGIDLGLAVDQNEKFARGKVVSCGERCPKNDDGAFYVPIGATVLYDRNKGSDITIDGETYVQTYYADLMLVL